MLRRSTAMTVLIALAASAALADEIILANGSRIVGQVVKLADGKLVVATDFAGEVPIDMSEVKGLSTEKPLTIRLAGGEQVVGTLTFVAPAGQRIAGEKLPAGEIAPADLTAIWTMGADSPEVAAAKAKAAAARPKWTAKLEAGVDVETGNTERVVANGRFELRRTTARDRLLMYARGRYARDAGVESAREILGGAHLEVDVDTNWFAFGSLELEHDRFEDLDLRTTASGGVGYFVLREPAHELKVRGGVGFLHESFTGGTNNSQATAEIGLDYRKEFTPWLSFTHSTTWYPTFEDFGDFRLLMENAAEIPLSDDRSWKLKLGVRSRYDATPQPGIERLDTYYFLNVVVDVE